MAVRFLLLSVVSLLPCRGFISSRDRRTGNCSYYPVCQVGVRSGNRRQMQEIDCAGLCEQRCSLHSRPNTCNRACGTCCVRCKCVPPGTLGNREVCGKCYIEMTTHGQQDQVPLISPSNALITQINHFFSLSFVVSFRLWVVYQ